MNPVNNYTGRCIKAIFNSQNHEITQRLQVIGYTNVYPITPKFSNIAYMAKDAGIRIRVEKGLREAFAQACKNEGTSASDVIRNYMESYVEYDVTQRQPDFFKLENSNQ